MPEARLGWPPRAWQLARRWAERFARGNLWGLSAVVLGLACLGGLAFDRYERRQLRKEAGDYLAAVTSLKAREIDAWLDERRGDAIVAGRAPAFSRAVAARVAGAPASELDTAAIEQAVALRKSYRYRDVFLLATDGRLLLGTDPDPDVLTPETDAAMRAALDAGAPRLSDLWVPQDGGPPLIDLAAPVRGPGDGEERVIGIVVLRIDPRLMLWPLLAAWPDASHDGQLMLVRREGSERLLFDVTRAAAGDAVGPRRSSAVEGSVYEPMPPGQLVRIGAEQSGRELLAAARDIAGWHWTLVATLPVAAVDARVGRATLLAMGWLVAMLGGAAVLARRYARRLSDDAVRASEELLRISQALAHAGSWDWNPRARRFAFSAELTRVLGVLEQPPPSPRRLLRLIPAAGRRGLIRALRVALREGTRMSLEHDVRRPDGQTRIVQHEAKRYAGDNEQSVRLVGVILDVTEHHRAERALRESQAELVAAREAALEAAQVKARFLANISHEIRTPLNAIVGLSHLLSAAALPPRERDTVHKLKSATRSLLDLINGVLDFSKLEAGKLRLDATPFFLDEVLDAVTNVVAGEAQEKGLQLSFSLAESVPVALIGDAVRLQQVLTNLAHNAVKFTSAGEIVVGVELLDSSGGRARLRFSVQDTGIGIAAEEIPKLFAAFTQADDSATRRFGGTGLGLAISAEIVQLMGGHIDVVSSPGRGSTFAFSIELPLSAEQRSPEPGAAGREPARVLVVDDHTASLMVLGRYLRDLGFFVESARSGPEALQRLDSAETEGQPFDLLLLDWRLPGPDGLATARSARSQLRAPPPIILVTAHEVEAEGARSGVEAVLSKPVTRSALLDAIARARGQALPPREIDAPPVLRGARVLVAEDNEINQQVARQLLESAGVEVHVVANGREAVAAAAAVGARYDAILMDLQMPEMDGYEATRAIRSQPKSAALPIIAMTAHTLELEKERCRQAGMNAHVAKPIDPAALFEALASWIRPPRDAARSLPLDIPGIDGEAALRRVCQNRGLLLKLLEELARTWRDGEARIRSQLARSERDEARRTAHTLRGAAANLGAEALAQAASRVERALGGTDPDATERAIVDLKAALEHVCSALDERLPTLSA